MRFEEAALIKEHKNRFAGCTGALKSGTISILGRSQRSTEAGKPKASSSLGFLF